MTTYSQLLQRLFCLLLAISLTLAAAGCSNVPRRFVWMAERDATLTGLVASPEKYQGKVVLLGGTFIEEEANEEYLWLRLRNRPLDQDYVPQLPADQSGSEAGFYWVTGDKNKLPQSYLSWAQMTVTELLTLTTR